MHYALAQRFIGDTELLSISGLISAPTVSTDSHPFSLSGLMLRSLTGGEHRVNDTQGLHPLGRAPQDARRTLGL